MFSIQDEDNLRFIRQFICKDLKHELEKDGRMESFNYFISNVKKANLASIGVLEQLNETSILPISMEHLIKGEEILFDPNGSTVVPGFLKAAFNDWTLDLGQDELGYSISESGRIRFNKKAFAELVMKMYRLVVDRGDPDALLVYNNEKGFWEDAVQPLHRLIIELAHAAGGNMEDSWTSHLESGIVDILKRKVHFVESADFNKNHFPFGNRTLDSSTGDLIGHDPKHLVTYGSDVNYNKEAECPTFNQFISDLFEDLETVQFLQEWFGYTLSSSHQANAFLIGIGAGANGKSTLFDILAQLVGIKNVSSAPLSNFNSEFGLEPLIGKKLNLATESDVDAFKTGKLKALTAGEEISINRKNKMEITTKLPTKLVFLMNELPLLGDDSFGFERRLIILPFDKTFAENEQDKDLPKKLSTELKGILNWSLEGLERLIKNDYTFTVSKPMRDAKDLYLGVGNPVENFVRDCIVAQPANVMTSTELINAYKSWMMHAQLPFKGTDNPQKFWRMFQQAMDLERIEFSRGKSSGRTVVRDITLK